MNLKTCWLLCLAFCGTMLAADKTADTGKPTPLSPDRVEVIYLASGRATTLQLLTKQQPSFFLGADIIEYTWDADLRQILLTPKVEEGETNMNVTIDGETYILLFKIVRDQRVQYRRTFTIENEKVTADEMDEELMAKARPMKPTEVDIVSLAQVVERAQADKAYAQTLKYLRQHTIAKAYSWNDSSIHLSAVYQFLNLGVLLFKIEWVNRSGDAVYLHARQYGLMIAGKKIPVIAAMQDAPTSIVYPNQHEVVWLAVQGYPLRRNNDWELVLPPDERAVPGIQRSAQ